MPVPDYQAGLRFQQKRRRSGATIASCNLRLGEFGNAEVEDLRVSVRPQHDVLRFDITMHDASFRERPPAPRPLARQFPARRADSFAHAPATRAESYLQ